MRALARQEGSARGRACSSPRGCASSPRRARRACCRNPVLQRAAAHPLLAALIAAIEAAGGEAIETNADILHKISGKDNPQTVLGVYRQLDTALDRDRPRRRAALDRRPGASRSGQSRHDPAHRRRGRRRRPDPGRRLRRSLLGRGGARLDGRACSPRRSRPRAGPEFVAWLRSGAGQLVGTSLQGELDYQAPRYARPAFLLVGNEQRGCREAYEAECDLLVKMPMLGKADSLNAAVATAVMAYEVINQWRSGMNRPRCSAMQTARPRLVRRRHRRAARQTPTATDRRDRPASAAERRRSRCRHRARRRSPAAPAATDASAPLTRCARRADAHGAAAAAIDSASEPAPHAVMTGDAARLRHRSPARSEQVGRMRPRWC